MSGKFDKIARDDLEWLTGTLDRMLDDGPLTVELGGGKVVFCAG